MAYATISLFYKKIIKINQKGYKNMFKLILYLHYTYKI